MNYRQPPRTVNIAVVVVAIRVKALASLPYTRPLRFLFNVWIGLRQTIQRLYYLRFFLSFSLTNLIVTLHEFRAVPTGFSFFLFFGVGAPGAAWYEKFCFFSCLCSLSFFNIWWSIDTRGFVLLFFPVYIVQQAPLLFGAPDVPWASCRTRVTSFIFFLPFLYFHVFFWSTSFYLCVA